MCGLYGALYGMRSYNAPTARVREGFVELFSTGFLRGKESSGIYAVPFDKTKEPFLYKKALHVTDYLQLAKTQSFLRNHEEYKYVLGHLRWATIGGVSDYTAHPWQYKHITLIHNGTLSDWRSLTTTYASSDSQALCIAMAENDPIDVLANLDGTAAVVWHDSRDGLVRAAVTRGRSLYFLLAKDTPAVLFSSEDTHLKWIASRGKSQLESNGVYYIKDRSYIVFNPDDPRRWTGEPLPAARKKHHSNYSVGHSRGHYQPPRDTSSKADTGTDDNSKRIQRHNNLLKTLDMQVDDVIVMCPLEWKAYESNTANQLRGVATGLDADTWQIEVKVYNVIRSDVYVSTQDVALITKQAMGETRNDLYIKVKVQSAATKDNGDLVVCGVCVGTVPASAFHQEQVADPDTPEEGDPTVNGKDVEDFVMGPDGYYISEQEFTQLADGGCAICGNEITSADAPLCGYLSMEFIYDDRSVCCPTCVDNIDATRMEYALSTRCN